MKYELHQEVALTADLPDSRLKADDIATLGEFANRPTNGEEGCVLEIFDAVGESIAVIAVAKTTIQPLKAGEVLSVRSFAQAS